MIRLQLEAHGVFEQAILDAFSSVDREDFIPMLFDRMAYQDFETTTSGSKRVIFRPYVLAKILQHVISLAPKKALIIGDVLGYSSVLLSKFCRSVTIAVLSNSDEILQRANLESFEKKSFQSVISNRRNTFDFIFFDGGFFRRSTIETSFDILSPSGSVVFLTKPSRPELSFSEFSFCDADIKCFCKKKTQTLFSERLYMSESFII